MSSLLTNSTLTILTPKLNGLSEFNGEGIARMARFFTFGSGSDFTLHLLF